MLIIKFDFQVQQRNDGANYNPANVAINLKRQLSDNPHEDTGKSQQFPTSSEINETSTCNSGEKYGGLSKVW